ncbi:MAG: hypothetical protein A2283_23930 [Lentisphaerae bacterium RIFOXYA12_FULL_48_11]|nr:MAG: hypothetical protein A2283_23930 [Lentisphaerae bacterium RIFOXYA12_FULL_48_11]
MMPLIDRIPEKIRTPVVTSIYAVAGGLAAVAFMIFMNRLFSSLWGRMVQLSPGGFIIGSFVVVAGSSIIVGLLLSSFSPEAAGSGIPQLKAAYWKDLGLLHLRPVLIKFIAGVISIGGGASLGREGPSVYVAGGTASCLARYLGTPKQRLRHATAVGSAAGLAAAFNTPLASITFVLEELIGDLNSRLLGSVVLASVAGAFVVHAILGSQPAFLMPAVGVKSWHVYIAVPIVAFMASIAGVFFQNASLSLRYRVKHKSRFPGWFQPVTGGLLAWGLGVAVFFATGRIGVFGLGYGDLSDALTEGIGWRVAALLALAKLGATIVCYGRGGCGGIFSPTLFIGAMTGFALGGLSSDWIGLSCDDQFVLAAVGMSACFGAVVRAPFTSILMIFEMTHQFDLVPALMLGALISQGVAHAFCRHNFYDEILLQDGHELTKIKPPRDLTAWRNMPVSAVTNSKPVIIRDITEPALRQMLSEHPYRCFPVEIDSLSTGVITRKEIEHALARGVQPKIERAVICKSDQTLHEIENLIIESPSGMVLVSGDGKSVTGLFTLHDLVRAQAAILE